MGESLCADTCIVLSAFFEFCFDAFLGGLIPQGDMFALAYDNSVGVVLDPVGDVGAGINDDLCLSEIDLTGVEGIFQNGADFYICPGAATGGGDAVVIEGGGDLREGFAS